MLFRVSLHFVGGGGGGGGVPFALERIYNSKRYHFTFMWFLTYTHTVLYKCCLVCEKFICGDDMSYYPRGSPHRAHGIYIENCMQTFAQQQQWARSTLLQSAKPTHHHHHHPGWENGMCIVQLGITLITVAYTVCENDTDA